MYTYPSRIGSIVTGNLPEDFHLGGGGGGVQNLTHFRQESRARLF